MRAYTFILCMLMHKHVYNKLIIFSASPTCACKVQHGPILENTLITVQFSTKDSALRSDLMGFILALIKFDKGVIMPRPILVSIKE